MQLACSHLECLLSTDLNPSCEVFQNSACSTFLGSRFHLPSPWYQQWLSSQWVGQNTQSCTFGSWGQTGKNWKPTGPLRLYFWRQTIGRANKNHGSHLTYLWQGLCASPVSCDRNSIFKVSCCLCSEVRPLEGVQCRWSHVTRVRPHDVISGFIRRVTESQAQSCHDPLPVLWCDTMVTHTPVPCSSFPRPQNCEFHKAIWGLITVWETWNCHLQEREVEWQARHQFLFIDWLLQQPAGFPQCQRNMGSGSL